MYDFYKNPPNTKQDLRDYLTSWLQPVEDGSPLVIQGETFIQELGFKRAFHFHGVFRSVSTGDYVWWVYEEQDIEKFPTKRYATYKALLENIIHDYYISWKLTG